MSPISSQSRAIFSGRARRRSMSRAAVAAGRAPAASPAASRALAMSRQALPVSFASFVSRSSFRAGAQEDAAHYIEVARWTERERLMNEKPALGFFFSGHPYNAYAAELAAFVKRRLGQLEPQREPLLLAGVVMSTRTQMTRRGKMAV
ncbi:MAG: DNA polymerase III subunit alpha, partial [Rhodocyclaceae bacterium]|nr:DNA polymerase III subunit alpha [Rhodocyclaceae bacterium]